MTPIERVQRRAQAAAFLNVSLYATEKELREAWKRRVKLTHPDRNEGNERAFRAVQTAFAILLGTAGDDAVIKAGEERAAIRPTRVSNRERSRTVRPA